MMAYRRKSPSASFDDVEDATSSSSSSSSSSLAAKAIRASSAHKDSSLSSAYGHPALSSPTGSTRSSSFPASSSIKDSKPYEYTSMTSINESKHGFWGALTRKAKSIIEDDDGAKQFDEPGRARPQVLTGTKYHNLNHSNENSQKTRSPALQKGLGTIASSLNYIGGTIGNAFEEGFTKVENRTADIIQETRKHIRKKPTSFEVQNQATSHSNTRQQPLRQNQMQPRMETDQEIQLKASRDVAMAMAAKAKLLLRELKTVKADLAFAKERCAQLEEENKILRESRDRGDSPEDDDLIRLQLETLLAEKARLAHENSVSTRENRFLREVVEYHQLTMQDVVYLDEGTEEVTEVYPIKGPAVSSLNSISTTKSPSLPSSLPPEASLDKHHK